MTPKTLHFGAFSPTGGTRRVMRALITGTPREGFAIRDFEFTLPEERRMRRFTEEDAVVLCAPVYYGRIPTPLQTKLPFEGNGARALAVVSYGLMKTPFASGVTCSSATAFRSWAEPPSSRSTRTSRPSPRAVPTNATAEARPNA